MFTELFNETRQNGTGFLPLQTHLNLNQIRAWPVTGPLKLNNA